EGGAGWLLPARGRRHRRGARGRCPDPRREDGRGDRDSPGGAALIERAFREEWGRVLATMAGFLGDLDRAEEATQSAFAVAAERCPRDGAPANPRAWLVATARNAAIDRIRREQTLADKIRLLGVPEMTHELEEDARFPDERLELVFTCCHPAL